MAFRLPQAPDPADRIRRFVSTALQAQQQDRNDMFQTQKAIAEMDAAQRRKQMMSESYKSSIDRITSVYAKPSDEYNREVEGEARKYDMSAPDIAKALRNNRRPEPVFQTRTAIDPQGRKIERIEKFDQVLGTSTVVPGSERVVDENLKIITADTEVDGKIRKDAVTLGAKGQPINRVKIGEETANPADSKTGETGYFRDTRTAGYEKAKSKASERALELGMQKIEIENAIKAFGDGEDGAVFSYNNAGKQIAKVEDAIALRNQLESQIKEAKKQESVWQKKIEGLKRTYGVGGEQPSTTAPAQAPASAPVRYYDPTTGTLKDSL